MNRSSGFVVTVGQATLHGTYHEYQPCFLIYDATGSQVGRVYLPMTSYAFTLASNRGHDADQIHEFMMRYALGRLEEELGAPGGRVALFGEQNAITWQIGGDELDDVLNSTIENKKCVYRHRVGRDLLCGASSNEDADKIGAIKLQVVAPTSVPVCNECQLPDGRVLCSNLSHPVVAGHQRGRMLFGAWCNAGRPDIADASRCRAGGHACWTGTIEEPVHTVGPEPSPLTLPEALDFLDAMWRLAFSKKQHLVQPLTFSDAGTLARDCSSAETFQSCVIALGDALDLIKVDDARLDAANVEGGEHRKQRLVCFGEFLSTKDGMEADVVNSAVSTLQAIRRVRGGEAHSGMASDTPRYLRELGLSDLATDYPALWDGLRARAVEALLLLRTQVQRLTEDDVDGG
jgi:hypothetical protein